MNKDYTTATGAGVGTALATIIVWAVQTFAGVDVPLGVEGAVGVVMSAALALFAARVVAPRLARRGVGS